MNSNKIDNDYISDKPKRLL